MGSLPAFSRSWAIAGFSPTHARRTSTTWARGELRCPPASGNWNTSGDPKRLRRPMLRLSPLFYPSSARQTGNRASISVPNRVCSRWRASRIHTVLQVQRKITRHARSSARPARPSLSRTVWYRTEVIHASGRCASTAPALETDTQNPDPASPRLRISPAQCFHRPPSTEKFLV